MAGKRIKKSIPLFTGGAGPLFEQVEMASKQLVILRGERPGGALQPEVPVRADHVAGAAHGLYGRGGRVAPSIIQIPDARQLARVAADRKEAQASGTDVLMDRFHRIRGVHPVKRLLSRASGKEENCCDCWSHCPSNARYQPRPKAVGCIPTLDGHCDTHPSCPASSCATRPFPLSAAL